MRHYSRRQIVWGILYTIAIGVVVLLLILIGVGYLRLPPKTGPSVTISEVEWTVAQGTNSYGQTWFGKSQFNYTPAAGWVPPSFAAGGQLLVTWQVVNYDITSHTICSVTVSSPFILSGTQEPLPMTINPGDDGGALGVWVTTPSSVSGTYPLSISVNALVCG